MVNSDGSSSKQALAALSLVALGVVFGDIGTSPLYALRECFYGEYGIAVIPDNIFGVLSLIFWSLVIVVSVKYLIFIMRADNRGEGGVIALTALISSLGKKRKNHYVLIVLGVFAACLLYGDGMITPAISVMSAVEGLKIIAPRFQPFVIPATLVILASLFILQHRGTAQVGRLFGPVILVWFILLATLGFRQIIINPEILKALLPWYGLKYLIHSGLTGFVVMGAVFLAVTGTEALYADMGHFGRKSIRLAWFFLVFPALLLNYFGQGAFLLLHPESASRSFYAIVPEWGVIPMVILATIATIIASQAVITGVFSLTKQAANMGYLPRLKIIHTSSKHFGQIYVPQVNWILMLATLGLVLGFQSSSRLAAAYGVAVASTMLVSTILFYVIVREKWGWSKWSASLIVSIFLIVDLSFFLANVSKLLHGAWFPLAIGAVLFVIMSTWRQGRQVLMKQLLSMTISLDEFVNRISRGKIRRNKRKVIFMTGHRGVAPIAMVYNLRHNEVLAGQVGILHLHFTEMPRVPNEDKVKVKELGAGIYLIEAFYGFMEKPNVPQVLELVKGQGTDFPISETSFFLGREKLIPVPGHLMVYWRALLFSFLSRNAYDASSFFGIPWQQVIEIGVRLEI